MVLGAAAVLAAVAGSQMSRFLTPQMLNTASGVLFALIGVIVLASAVL